MANTYVNSTGVILTDTSDILAAVQAEWTVALGTNLITTPSTPQGVLIAQETQARTNVMNNNAALANQINPNVAGGVFLKAICALFNIPIPAATYTTVTATLSGVAGTIIAAGTQATTGAGDIFQLISPVKIGVGGTVSGNFQALVSGAIPCSAGSLSNIAIQTAVIGWESITNPLAGVIGISALSDAQIRTLRNNTLGANGVSSVAAQISALYLVPGVTSLAYLENNTNVPQTINGIYLVANSVWACVSGGTPAAIGAALLAGKTAGAAWNGAQGVTVIEAASGQSYQVLYDVPTPVPILVRITLSQGTSTANLSVSGPQAVLDFANGLLAGEPGFVIGANASPYDLASAIAIENPGVKVRKVEVALVSTGIYQTTEIAIALNQIATVSSVTVVMV